MVRLLDYQVEALQKLKTGSILCGGVGSGKSVVALSYYITKCGGNYEKPRYLEKPRDLYVITTAKKRNSFEWDRECGKFCIVHDQNKSIANVKLTIDSWNNIKKYKDIYGQFFIFDEQRVVGSGAWAKTFLNITRKNEWILLSATPGDKWEDYIPVFIANRFFTNRTEFYNRHCIFSRFTNYPKIEGYIGEYELNKLRDSILVPMRDQRETVRHYIDLICEYNTETYNIIWRDRWNPYDNCPIEETGKLFYLMRKVCNENISRIDHCKNIIKQKNKVIIFYNHTYELEMLINMCNDIGIDHTMYNGIKHEELPTGSKWVYLVQYIAGSEGWNCITTDTIIFYSQTYSYRQYEQACGRIDRITTMYKDLYYYNFRSNSPIDLAILRAMKEKRNFNERKFKG